MSLQYFLTERCPGCDRLSAPIYREGWGVITSEQEKNCERCRARKEADRAKYGFGARSAPSQSK
jgi:hypothetical protein